MTSVSSASNEVFSDGKKQNTNRTHAPAAGDEIEEVDKEEFLFFAQTWKQTRLKVRKCSQYIEPYTVT